LIAINFIGSFPFLEDKVMQFQKSLIGAAVATSLGIAAVPAAHADLIVGDWTGVFTMLASSGAFTANNDVAACYTAGQDADATPGNYSGGCNRTGTVTGTMTFNTANGTGSATINPFSFFGGGKATATSASFVAVGDGKGGPGTLVLGNMGFDWNGNIGIPVSIVFDAQGFFAQVGAGITVSSNIDCLNGAPDACVAPASDNGDGAFDGGAIMATTDFNTASTPGATLGSNPSGTLPFGFANTIGGDPMLAGPFSGQNANFDFLSLHVTSCTDTGTGQGIGCTGPVVPVPAAVWLFGSGLLGLVGVARRRKSK
jgi:hypothetical protein